MWIIACVLAATGRILAQPPASDVESAVPVETSEVSSAVELEAADSAPATGELQIAADLGASDEGASDEVSESAASGIVLQASATPPIERIESADSDIVDEELPPTRGGVASEPANPPREQRRLSPWRGYFGVGTGLALHLNARKGFQQNVLAPAYLSLRSGGVLPAEGRLRHALQLGVSTNLSREGAYPSGTLALRQWVIVPSYVLRVGLEDSPLPAWIATARVGLPIVASPDVTVGAELALGAQYFARSGVALFAELIYDIFVGGRERDGLRSTHHLLTIEVGLQFELEVLP